MIVTGNAAVKGRASIGDRPNSAIQKQWRSLTSFGPAASPLVQQYASNTVLGSLLVSFVIVSKRSAFTPVASDSVGNTWTTLSPYLDFTPAVGNNISIAAAYAINNDNSGTISVIWTDTATGEFNEPHHFIAEYTGVATSLLDTSSQKPAASSTATPTTNSFTTTTRDLILACFADRTNTPQVTAAGSGYTIVANGDYFGSHEELLGTNVGSKTASFTLNTPSDTWAMYALAFTIAS